MNNPNHFTEYRVGGLLLQVGKKYRVDDDDITFRGSCILNSIIKRGDEIHINIYSPTHRRNFGRLVVQWEVPKLGKSLTTLTAVNDQ